jgi:hypothetical protein
VTPEADIRLALSGFNFELAYVPDASRKDALSACRSPWMTVPLSTDNGRDSRLPPNIDPGGMAFIDALVSTLLRLRRFEDDASVKIEASSVRTLFAVAPEYVVGWARGAR